MAKHFYSNPLRMKNVFLLITLALLAGFCGKKKEEIRPFTRGVSFLQDQYVVILKDSSVINDNRQTHTDRKEQRRLNEPKRNEKKSKVRSVVRKHNVLRDTILYADLFVGFRARLSSEQVKNLKEDPDVKEVYPDFEVRLRDPIQQSILFRDPIQQDAYLRDPIQQDILFTDPENGITCAVGRAGGPKDGSINESAVWVMDTGVQLDHPELNVETDPALAVSFIPGEIVDDLHGHGTHVAGIIGAKQNGIGVTGVSAGARIIPVKVLENSGRGTWSYLLLGLDHVAQYSLEGDVVNLSLGAYDIDLCDPSKDQYKELRKMLVDLARDKRYIVIAAGNEGMDAKNSLPGCINHRNIFTVAAMMCRDECADYSNFGNPPVDWIAVGSDVLSTYKGGTYRIMSGTSMAAAVVSGVVHANGGPPDAGDSKECGTPQRRYKYAKVR